MLYAIVKFLFGWIFTLIWRPRVYNKQKLRLEGGAIFVCNHVSAWDPILLALISPRVVHYMAKSSLFRNPIAGAVLRGLGAFPVNRGAGDVGSVKMSLKIVSDGKIMGMFPEGTRIRTGEVTPFQKGAALLAERSGKPVVPIYIYPRSYKRERVLVAVGEPVILGAREEGVTLEQKAEELRQRVFELRAFIPEIKLDEELDSRGA